MKTAVITGAAQGIGRATAKALLTKGYNVIASDIDAEAGAELIKAYEDLGKIYFVKADMSQAAEVEQLATQSLSLYGQIDAVINNVGIGISKPLNELSLEDWNKVLATNLTSIFLLTRALLESLKQARGSIVNIASTRALMSEANSEAYAASKGGIVALTHALAVSLGPEVRVNCISPGWIETAEWQKESRRSQPKHSHEDKAQHLVGRVGKAEDIASMICYLLAEESGFITGQNLVIDGGMTKKMIYVD